MKMLITLERDETGIVVAECPAPPGCVSQGVSEAEAIANMREAIAGCLAARRANHLPIARYKLADLVAQCDHAAPLSDEDRVWLDTPVVSFDTPA